MWNTKKHTKGIETIWSADFPVVKQFVTRPAVIRTADGSGGHDNRVEGVACFGWPLCL